MAENPDTNPIPLPHESLLPASPPLPPAASAWPEEYGRARGPWEEPWAPAAESVYSPANSPANSPAYSPASSAEPDERAGEGPDDLLDDERWPEDEPVPPRGLPRPEELLIWGGFTTVLAIVLSLVTGSGVLRAVLLGGLGAAATGVLWLAARFGDAPSAGGTGGGRTGA